MSYIYHIWITSRELWIFTPKLAKIQISSKTNNNQEQNVRDTQTRLSGFNISTTYINSYKYNLYVIDYSSTTEKKKWFRTNLEKQKGPIILISNKKYSPYASIHIRIQRCRRLSLNRILQYFKVYKNIVFKRLFSL